MYFIYDLLDRSRIGWLFLLLLGYLNGTSSIDS